MDRRFASLVIASLIARTAGATSYAPPEKHDVSSPGGGFVVHVDPEAHTLTVASARDPATPAWRIDRPIGFDSVFVADDGRSVAVVAWRFVKVEDLDKPAVELWNATSRFRVYSYRELVAQPPRIHGPGPIGGFWREWRAGASQDGDTLAIETTGPFAYAIDLHSGDVERAWRLAGIARWAVGFAMLALALAGIWWTRRSLRATEFRSERNLLVLSTCAPIGTLLWLWLDLAGIPFVPAEVGGSIKWIVFVVTLVIAPGSVVAALRVPPGSRALRLVVALASLVALLAVRILY